MNDRGVKIYIYGLLEGNKITYIGKSSAPKARLYTHCSRDHSSSRRMKILDYFYDIEQYWIKKLIIEGHDLVNQQFQEIIEDWEIDDIITVGTLKRVSCKNKKTGIIYNTIQEASDDLQISRWVVCSILNNPKHPLTSTYSLEYL